MTYKDTPEEIVEAFHRHLASSPFVLIGLEAGRHLEPMTVRVDDRYPGEMFMFSGEGNRIAPGGAAIAQFASKGHDFFASLIGSVAEEADPDIFDRLWDSHAEAWFPNGKADARLNRFTVGSAEMWETDVSLSGRLKMLTGRTITGRESSSHAVVDSIR